MRDDPLPAQGSGCRLVDRSRESGLALRKRVPARRVPGVWSGVPPTSAELTPEEVASIRAPIERASTLSARAFTHEAYRRSPDIPRVRGGEKTFFTVCEGPLLAFGFRMDDVPNAYAAGGDAPHLGRSRSQPPSKGWFVSLYPNVAIPIRVNTFRLEVCLPETPGRSRILQCGNFHRDAQASPGFPAYHRGLAERYAQVFGEDRIAIEAVQRARGSPVWRQHFYAPFRDELHYAMHKLVADDVSRPNAAAPDPLSVR